MMELGVWYSRHDQQADGTYLELSINLPRPDAKNLILAMIGMLGLRKPDVPALRLVRMEHQPLHYHKYAEVIESVTLRYQHDPSPID